MKRLTRILRSILAFVISAIISFMIIEALSTILIYLLLLYSKIHVWGSIILSILIGIFFGIINS